MNNTSSQNKGQNKLSNRVLWHLRIACTGNTVMRTIEKINKLKMPTLAEVRKTLIDAGFEIQQLQQKNEFRCITTEPVQFRQYSAYMEGDTIVVDGHLLITGIRDLPSKTPTA